MLSSIEQKGKSKDAKPQNVIRFLEKALKAARGNTALTRELFPDETELALIGEYRETYLET